jgi:hypothetical protein
MNEVRDQKRVYFSSDRELARAWAVVGCSGGTLYRVRPVPPSSLEIDPDYPDGGFSARRAEVLEVVETTIAMSEDQANRIVGRHQTWSDLSPMYDEDSYLLPPPEHRSVGKTPADHRHFGRWFPLIGPLRLEPSGEIWAVQPTIDRTPPRLGSQQVVATGIIDSSGDTVP